MKNPDLPNKNQRNQFRTREHGKTEAGWITFVPHATTDDIR